jgi:hypothetical protein
MEVVAELAPHPAPPLRQVTTAVSASPPEMFASASGGDASSVGRAGRSAGRPPPCQLGAPGERFVAAAGALGRGAGLRRAAPAAHHRAAPSPEQDRRRARRALALHAQRGGAIPAHVKRAVWLRAGGRCECRLESGEVCGSTYRLELDHFPVPKALGGPATVDNIRLACRPHNVGAARQILGDAVMDRYTREASAPP